MTVTFFSHLGICTSDLARSRAFYTGALGFTEVSGISVGPEVGALIELDTPDLALTSVFLERDGARIELMEFGHPPHGDGHRRPFDTRGLTHLAVRTDDTAAVAAEVVALGGTVLEHTRVGDPEVGVELLYVLDPDGVRIELIQVPGDPTLPPGEPLEDAPVEDG